MALILKNLYLGYKYLFTELVDKRTNNLFLLSSPLQPAFIVLFYLYFVQNLGPKLMKNRQPFDLKPILIIYNSLQILLNTAIGLSGAFAAARLNWKCALIDYSESEEGRNHIRLAHYFYLLKILDMLDTVFFVLRKSKRQLTFLHVYHHAAVFIGSFIASKFFGGGELLYTGVLNCIVHSIMFGYYLLTAFDKEWKKNTPLKKFLTQLQLVQFAMNILIYGRLLFIPSCFFPKLVPFLYVPQNVFMLVLFSDFYKKAYVKPKL